MASVAIKKDTVYLSPNIREKAVEIKKSMKLSMNALYNKAMEDFIERQELDKWLAGAEKASKNTSYRNDCLSMNIGGDIYDY